MSKDKVIDSMGRIDDDMIQSVDALRRKKKRPAWLKWGAMAACLCLMASIAIPTFTHKGGPDSDDLVGDVAPFFLNGCYYEAVDAPDILAIYGLPEKITPDMAGDHVAYIDINYDEGFASYEPTPSKTDNEVYVYAPAPSEAVYVYREGEYYMAAIFCNFETFGDSNTEYELAELYRVYNVKSAEDIASISEVGWQRSEVIGNTVTDCEEIRDFYGMTISLPSYGNDDFQSLTFTADTEEEQIEMHRAFADDLRKLRIETSAGLRFTIDFHPDFGWIYGSGIMSYYQINEQMAEWFADNMN